VHDTKGGTTYCHGCGEPLMVRDWYELLGWGLDDSGACQHCGTACAGVFEAKPGDWGAKRQPVRMKSSSACKTRHSSSKV